MKIIKIFTLIIGVSALLFFSVLGYYEFLKEKSVRAELASHDARMTALATCINEIASDEALFTLAVSGAGYIGYYEKIRMMDGDTVGNCSPSSQETPRCWQDIHDHNVYYVLKLSDQNDWLRSGSGIVGHLAETCKSEGKYEESPSLGLANTSYEFWLVGKTHRVERLGETRWLRAMPLENYLKKTPRYAKLIQEIEDPDRKISDIIKKQQEELKERLAESKKQENSWMLQSR